MTRIQQDFSFYTGEDKSLVYTITDDSGASTDMIGACAQWCLQDEPDSGSLITYETGGGIVVSGCTVTVSLAASDTTGCALDGTFYTELSASLSSNVSVLAVGIATINRRKY